MSEFHNGQQLQEEGTLEEIATYRRALELNSNDSWAYHQMGEALAKLGRFDEAVTAFRHAIELKPDFSWSYHHLGDALAQQQQWEQSAVAFRKAIEFNPEHLGSYVGLGNSLAKLGQLDEAIVTYRRAIKLNPDADWIHYALANTLQQRTQSDLAEVIASYRHTTALNPDIVQAYRNFLQVQPDNWEVWLQLGELLGKLSHWDEAIATYRRALEINPEAYECHHHLGEAIYQRVMENPETFFSEYNLAKLPHKDYQVFDPELPEVCFLNDDAFLQTTAHLDDATYVVELYRVYLRRTPSDADKQSGINWQQIPGHSRELGLKGWRGGLEEFQSLFKSSVLFQCLQESINCYRRAIELNQHHYQSHYRLGDVLSVGKINEAITVYHNLALLLAAQGLINEAVDCFDRITHIQHRSEKIYNLIWRQLNQLIPMPQTNSHYPKEFAQGKVAEYFQKTSQYREMNLDFLTDPDKNFLEVAGLSMANLELIREDSQDLEEIYINSFNSGNSNTILANKKSKIQNYKFVFQPHLNKPNSYQQSIVETGYIYAACPVTGKILRSNQSFYDVAWLPMISYRFVGSEIFYLVVGHFFGAKMFVYFPGLELVVKFGHFVDSKDIINRLKSNMVNHWEEVKNYMDKPKKKPVAILGSISVIGHYLWNELTGLYYLCENEILEKLTNILIEPHEYYNVGDIFPEIRDKISSNTVK